MTLRRWFLGLLAAGALAVPAACSSSGDGPAPPGGGGDGGASEGNSTGDAASAIDAPVGPVDGASDATADAPSDASTGETGVEGGSDAGPLACIPFTWNGMYDLPAGRVCSIHGVCLDNPRYLGTGLTTVWAANDNDVWMAGPGAVVHIENGGTTISGLTDLPITPTVIAGSGASDVWVGPLHWDGAALTDDAAHAPPGRAWFAAANDGWAVHGPKMAHWDGATWTDVATPSLVNLQDVFGFASNDVLAVGGIGVWHWDGATWSAYATPLPAGGTANRVWGLSSSDFWLSGGDRMRHLTGGAYASYNDVVGSKVWGNATTVEYLTPSGGVGRFNGSFFFEETFSSTTCGRCGGGCTDLWVTPTGQYFLPSGIKVTPGNGSECGMWSGNRSSNIGSLNSGDVVGIGASALLPRSDGSAWVISAKRLRTGQPHQTFGIPWAAPLWGIANDDDALFLSGASDDDIWVSGNSIGGGSAIASHWDGAAWTYGLLPGVPTSPVHAKTASSAWVGVGAKAAYFDGATWTDKGTVGAKNIVGIWGDGPASALAVGDELYRWNGATWTSLATGFSDYVTIGGTAFTNLLAVRAGGRIVAWNGATATTLVTTGTIPNPLAVTKLSSFAFRGDELWASAAAFAQPPNSLQPHLWRLRGACWDSPKDGTRILVKLPVIGALGARVAATDGKLWIDGPP